MLNTALPSHGDANGHRPQTGAEVSCGPPGGVPRYLAEVARVLAPGGRFLYADFRRRSGVRDWEAVMADAPLRLLSCEVIGEEVLRAMERNLPTKTELTSHHGR